MGVTYQRDSSLRFAVFRMTCGGVGEGSGEGGVLRRRDSSSRSLLRMTCGRESPPSPVFTRAGSNLPPSMGKGEEGMGS